MAYDPNDPADKKVVADLVKAALAEQAEEHEAEVKGLKDKKTELLGKIAKLKAGEGDGTNSEKLEAELEATKTELVKVQKDYKKAVTELETTKGELGTERTASTNEFKENQLTAALTGVKVDAKFLPAVKAMLASKVDVKLEGSERKALVGDKALGDFIKEWSQGDEGKAYITAPNNNGGGSGGDGGSQGDKPTKTRAEYDTMAPAEASKFFSEGGTLTD